jgi:hypothetical protein
MYFLHEHIIRDLSLGILKISNDNRRQPYLGNPNIENLTLQFFCNV